MRAAGLLRGSRITRWPAGHRRCSPDRIAVDFRWLRPILPASPRGCESRMRSRLTMVASLLSIVCLVSCRTSGTGPRPTATTIQQDNDETARLVLARIRGKEQLPADQVFNNVRFLANVPAGIFLQIMNVGYARALGVRCTHCHVQGNFPSVE